MNKITNDYGDIMPQLGSFGGDAKVQENRRNSDKETPSTNFTSGTA